MNKKVCLITGVTSGIGKALFELLIQKEYFVIGTYHSDENTTKVLEEKYKNNCELYKLDLCSSDSILEVTRKISEKYKKINILINNAGYVFIDTLLKTSFEEIDKQINTNLTGTIKFTKQLIPNITEAIINIGSSYSKEGHADYVTYCASKWGIRGFTQSLADEYPDLKVLIVNPGPTKTKMNNFYEKAVEPVVFAEKFMEIVINKMSEVKSGSDIDIF